MIHVQYDTIPLRTLKIQRHDEKKSTINRLSSSTAKIGNNVWTVTSRRFWKSFFDVLGVSPNILDFFEPIEVIERVIKKKSDIELRFCTELGENPKLLAVSNPKKEFITPGKIRSLSETHEFRKTEYNDGIMTLTKTAGKRSEIGPDAFYDEHVIDVPVDGYGTPSIYLSMLREVCTNGMVARSNAFRSDIVLDRDNALYSLDRAMSSFTSKDGYNALRNRLSAAQETMASLNEAIRLRDRLTPVGQTILERATGNINAAYGTANINSISKKKQQVLPVNCTVYDLLNVASEISTHVVTGNNAQRLQGWVGSILQEEFDLEGMTKPKSREFREMWAA